MNYQKRIGTILAACACLLTFSGCSEENKNENKAEETTEMTMTSVPLAADVDAPAVPELVMEDEAAEEEPANLGNPAEDVTIYINGVVTSESDAIDYVVQNLSENEYMYNEDIALYRMENGNWVDVETKESAYLSGVGTILPGNAVQSEQIQLSQMFESLPEGTYKMEKMIYNEAGADTLSVQFNIISAK